MDTATVERRAAVEFRFDGRTLTGPAVTYGDIAQGPKGPERFEPRAFVSGLDTAMLNLQHDRQRVIAAQPDALAFTDSPLALDLRASLRSDGAEAQLVRRGALGGLSVGFVALREHRDAGTRVIARAHLDHVALVDRPAYPGSTVELRQLDAAAILGVIPEGVDMQCTCQGPECGAVRFEPGAFDRIGVDHDVLAIAGRASEVIGSLRRGTMRIARATDQALRLVGAAQARVTRGVEVVIERAITGAAAAVIANATGAPFYVRPIIRNAVSDFYDEGGVRVYRSADVRAMLIKPTVNDRGQIPAVIRGVRTGPIPPAYIATAPEPERRRVWL